jgi:ABC-type lipoprotein export system ATPase subunit
MSNKSSEIVNMYKKIPKEFIDNVDNPNFKLHHLKIPFRMCIFAPSGSGKTNFLINLISIFSKGNGTFKSIYII